jgi:hypothetical protein
MYINSSVQGDRALILKHHVKTQKKVPTHKSSTHNTKETTVNEYMETKTDDESTATGQLT